MLPSIAVSCSEFQRSTLHLQLSGRHLPHTASHCSTLQHTATHCNALQCTEIHSITLPSFYCRVSTVCCSVFQCIAVRCIAFDAVILLSMRPHQATSAVVQCVAVCCSVLQCVAVCCSVLQCVAEWCCAMQCVAVR